MKKLLTVILLIALLALSIAIPLTACTGTTFTLVVPDGAPALAVASIVANNNIKSNNIEVTITNGVTVQSKVAANTCDMAIVPLDMGARLYNQGAQYQLVSINSFGLLYIVGSKAMANIDDMVGQVLFSIGKNNIPQRILTAILDANGVEYAEVQDNQPIDGKVAIRYFADASDIIPLLNNGTAQFALLGEPAVSRAISVVPQIEQIFDVQQLYQQATGSTETGYPQAGLIVSNEMIAQYPDVVDAVIDVLQGNDRYVADNISTVGQLMADNGSAIWSSTNVTTQLVARCNVGFVLANTMSDEIGAYLLRFGITMDNNFVYEG